MFDIPLLLTSILLIIAGVMYGWSAWLHHKTGIPVGRVVYSDTGRRRELIEPLYSRELMLAGKPDYLVELPDGEIVPMEVKSGRAAEQPYEGHVMQLIAYCALVQDDLGQRPSHGLLRYADRTFAVDYTAEMEQKLVDLLAEMRHDLGEGHVARSHNIQGKCQSCGVAHACLENLSS